MSRMIGLPPKTSGRSVKRDRGSASVMFFLCGKRYPGSSERREQHDVRRPLFHAATRVEGEEGAGEA